MAANWGIPPWELTSDNATPEERARWFLRERIRQRYMTRR